MSYNIYFIIIVIIGFIWSISEIKKDYRAFIVAPDDSSISKFYTDLACILLGIATLILWLMGYLPIFE